MRQERPELTRQGGEVATQGYFGLSLGSFKEGLIKRLLRQLWGIPRTGFDVHFSEKSKAFSFKLLALDLPNCRIFHHSYAILQKQIQ